MGGNPERSEKRRRKKESLENSFGQKIFLALLVEVLQKKKSVGLGPFPPFHTGGTGCITLVCCSRNFFLPPPTVRGEDGVGRKFGIIRGKRKEEKSFLPAEKQWRCFLCVLRLSLFSDFEVDRRWTERRSSPIKPGCVQEKTFLELSFLPPQKRERDY